MPRMTGSVSSRAVTQNSPFLPQQWRWPSPVLTAPTHGWMARLSWARWRAMLTFSETPHPQHHLTHKAGTRLYCMCVNIFLRVVR